VVLAHISIVSELTWNQNSPSFLFGRAVWDNEFHILSDQICLRSYAGDIPGPADAASASSPMKKSRSSVPLFAERWPLGPAPPVRNEGLLATAGRPEPDPPDPPAGPLVAMAVGNTNDGESFPAKPSITPLVSSLKDR
jgi:hypothetical protein